MTLSEKFLLGRALANNWTLPSFPVFRSDRNFTRYSPLQLESCCSRNLSENLPENSGKLRKIFRKIFQKPIPARYRDDWALSRIFFLPCRSTPRPSLEPMNFVLVRRSLENSFTRHCTSGLTLYSLPVTGCNRTPAHTCKQRVAAPLLLPYAPYHL